MSRPRRSTGLLVGAAALIAFAGAGPSGSRAAGIEVSTSFSQVCTPLNISWTPDDNAYPYTVWVSGIRGAADTFRIEGDFQFKSKQLTFQYVVPPPTIGFQSYIVAVADSKGNGNSTRPLTVNVPNGANVNACNPFTSTPAWLWAGDPQNQGAQMEQCGTVRFYNIDQRGTAPFTITWIPIKGNPITVNVPKSATLNTSAFIYETKVPFPVDTQFQVVLGDATGGASGGGSELYTTAFSMDQDCLEAGYKLPGKNSTYALPPSFNLQSFRALPGAINGPTSDSGSSSNGNGNGSSGSGGGGGGGGSNVGAIAGGAIGGAIALVIVIGCLIAFLLYKRRQKRRKEDARKEEVHFVDLDGDEDAASGSEGPGAAARRRSRIVQSNRESGIQQTYSVSPFTYQPSAPDVQPGHELADRTSRHSSYGGAAAMGASGTATPSSPMQPADGAQYNDMLAAAGMARVPSSNHSGAGGRPTSSHSFGSNHGLLSSPTASSPQLVSPVAPFAFADRHRSNSHGSTGAYRLRTTNDDLPPAHDGEGLAMGHASGSASRQAGPLPNKAPLPGDEETRQSQNARRVLMHSDGGPLPQPESDDDDAVEELPPQYGGWTSTSGGGGGAAPPPLP
ncbi:uncharacterized protein PFL1_02812 [Pseudozyma flocculosa PF-1]|uniref:Uncharacterized protein n=2 Tax=Pseudozyma flocculosa TaxID=84751 RepID=A0A5C3F0V2_9BASI|nr:uncharacterized protein PFL1_02812 [Pseudozyma flocculosa PF-1]EPQ29593.1 hypothetical protein PFL1_02812 [Pseudozyma flocculosa PF-1]SPO38144.1 uncharacterized protein PSFLO_03621 [Pseudozyma flocculosa]